MNMVIPDEGKIKWLQWMATGSPPSVEDFVVDLYQNNYTPVAGSSAANFTVATFTGYAQYALARSTFGTPTATGGTGTVVSSASPAFSCTGGSAQTCYGWYIRSASTGKVLAAALFDTPRVMSNGTTETLTPFQLQMDTL